MIDNSYIQVAIGLLKIISSKFNIIITREQTAKIEKKLITFANRYNSFINVIVNNRFSNWLKEFYYQITGFPYPEFMYSDQLNLYISSLPDNPKGGEEVEILTCDKSTHAKDFYEFGYFKKKKLLALVNNTLENQNIKFRYVRLLEYKHVG